MNVVDLLIDEMLIIYGFITFVYLGEAFNVIKEAIEDTIQRKKEKNNC